MLGRIGVAMAVAAGLWAAPAGTAGAQIWKDPGAFASDWFPAAPQGDDGHADDAVGAAQDAFVAVFYHELGHALIDIMELPVLGLEEDAADILSVVLIHEMWEEESADLKLRAAAGFWALSAQT